MSAGDLVKCDNWVHEGMIGVIIRVKDAPPSPHVPCVGAYVLLGTGVKLIRLDNLRLVDEGR